MNPEKQRIAIAKAVGWEYHGNKYFSYWTKYGSADRAYLPDYLNDLNAIHDAEEILNDEQRITFSELLMGDLWDVAHATAEQRAEAFLKTLNLWEESE